MSRYVVASRYTGFALNDTKVNWTIYTKDSQITGIYKNRPPTRGERGFPYPRKKNIECTKKAPKPHTLDLAKITFLYLRYE